MRVGSPGAPRRKGAVVDDGKQCHGVCGPETKMSERVQPRVWGHGGAEWGLTTSGLLGRSCLRSGTTLKRRRLP